ncbi:Vacuolar ATP synthase subunit C [Tieghemiomyces parasiticus]|uniref:V-type proton ATPase subunit C n=1 Tax=Tieghemiomyces parasiticus TaxID=78921 RepID=A0A9W8AL43_9FUNG|nr:Vacuolar ATP synthase subunit C [Tieghemiomyces parasiticus]
MPNYWLLSLPAAGDRNAAWQRLRAEVAGDQHDLCTFSIPEFKIGTLDSLVQLSDELVKTDQTYGALATKLADVLRNLVQGDEQVLASMLSIGGKSVDQYLKSFSWDTTKYRTDKALDDVVQAIAQQVSIIEGALKTKMGAYNQVKGNLLALNRKQNGNLSIRNLANVIKEDHVVQDSEYLQTLFVAVPNNLRKEWAAEYETLTQMVVPRSSREIATDNDYTLYGVTVFQRVAEEFGAKCRDHKYIVRDFRFDPDQEQNDRSALLAAQSEEKELQTTLTQWAHASFGEAFASWIHIKALRVFVESVLRYGLPPDFIAALIKPKPKTEMKLRDSLVARYASLEGQRAQKPTGKAKAADHDDGNHLDEFQSVLGSEYTPFVLFNVNWDIFEKDH